MKFYRLLFVAIIYSSTTAYSQTSEQKAKASLLTWGGIPETPKEKVNILTNIGYMSGYSEEYKCPLWTIYRYGNVKNKGEYKAKFERPSFFKTDFRTKSKVTHDDYSKSGYDRGHMAPNSGMASQYGHMAQLETFLMSNICPQRPNLNQGIWKFLEQKVALELSQVDKKNAGTNDIYVLTGPIFENGKEDKIDNDIVIPTAFYKIILVHKGYSQAYKAISFIFPNEMSERHTKMPKDEIFLAYAVTVDQIEDKTGINFMSELTKIKESNIETKKFNFKVEEI